MPHPALSSSNPATAGAGPAHGVRQPPRGDGTMRRPPETETDHVIPKPAPGTPAPWFKGRVLEGNPNYSFHTVAGRVVVMLFMGSAASAAVQPAHALLLQAADRFDDRQCCFFGVTHDPDDERTARVRTRLPGIRYLFDDDRAIAAAYGAWRAGAEAYESYVMVLDRQLRVAGRFPLPRAEEALALVERLLGEARAEDWAPVLLVPRVFDSATCKRLVHLYDSAGGEESGFMREVDGKTVTVIDHGHKRRADHTIRDEALCSALNVRVGQCVRPAIQRAFNFDATRMERYIIACYDAAVGGHFRPHRDNTTKGTAHRRFAVTINLNEEFDGGELRFPEYGARTYRAPPGGAIVFGCGLLHEATPVTRGRRYAFLPFLYDDAAAALREANNIYLGEGVTPYQQS